MLIDSAKRNSDDNTADSDQLFWMMRQAPFGVDFPLTARKIENMKGIAMTAIASCGDETIGQRLAEFEFRIYFEYILAVNAMSSEGGKMIRTLQTQVTEQFGQWQQTQKGKGVQGGFQPNFNNK